MKLKRMIHIINMNLKGGASARGKYLKDKKILGYVGDYVRFQPRVIPLYPELIKLHNNIVIGANVTFVTHDAIHLVLNKLDQGEFPEMVGCIEIMDNVFVGSGSTIMPNVRIGNNVIIGANSLVSKDCEPNSIYAGVPAKKIGTFDDLVEKRKSGDYSFTRHNQNITEEEINNAWKRFYESKNIEK